MIKLRRFVFVLCSLGLILLLSSCKDVVLLNPQGPIGAYEKDLMFRALLLMFIVVIPTIIAVFVIARRYRASNTKAKYDPSFGHSVWLELFWWSIPIIIIVFLALLTWRTTHELDPYQKLALSSDSPYAKYLPDDVKNNSAQVATKAIRIDVVALPWRWLFIYPDYGIATIDYIEFPARTPINFKITSDGLVPAFLDHNGIQVNSPINNTWARNTNGAVIIKGHDAPMNSFQIPQLGGQIYAMAGMQTKLHLMANEIGTYGGRSVSFSGAGFSGMTFVANAVSDADFQKWVKNVKTEAKKELTFAGNYQELAREPEILEGVITDGKVTKVAGPDFEMKYAEKEKSECAFPEKLDLTHLNMIGFKSMPKTTFECFRIPKKVPGESVLFDKIIDSYGMHMTAHSTTKKESAHA